MGLGRGPAGPACFGGWVGIRDGFVVCVCGGEGAHGGEARRSVALGSVTKEQLVRGALGLESPQVQAPLGTRVSAVSWRIPERDLSVG